MAIGQRSSRTGSVWLIVLGSLATATALLVAVIPVNTSQLNYPSCGSAVFPRGGGNFNSSNSLWDSLDNSYYATLCGEALVPMRVSAAALAVVGVTLLIFGIANRTRTRSSAVSNNPADVYTQLQQLAALHAAGTLTDGEFESAKRKLVGPNDQSQDLG